MASEALSAAASRGPIRDADWKLLEASRITAQLHAYASRFGLIVTMAKLANNAMADAGCLVAIEAPRMFWQQLAYAGCRLVGSEEKVLLFSLCFVTSRRPGINLASPFDLTAFSFLLRQVIKIQLTHSHHIP
jgi:hypothetical protein